MLSIHVFRIRFVACPVTPAVWWRFQAKCGAGIHGHSAPQLPDFNPLKKNPSLLLQQTQGFHEPHIL